MSRALAGRSLLLLTSVALLLWATLCVASPMGDRSSHHSSSATDITHLPPPVADSEVPSVLNQPERDAFLSNAPRYKNYPVLDILLTQPDTVDYAREKYGGVWLAPQQTRASDRFEVKFFKKGSWLFKKGSWLSKKADAYDTKEVKQKLAEAHRDGIDHGLAVKYLKHGEPFTGRRIGADSWSKVWNQRISFTVPQEQHSPEWLNIREALQANQHIVLHDEAKNAKVALRVLHDGQIQSKILDLGHAIRKRTNKGSNSNLVIVGLHDSEPKQRPLPRFESLDAYLQNLPHYKGRPVLPMEDDDFALIKHASNLYDGVYLAAPPYHAGDPFEVNFFPAGEDKKPHSVSPHVAQAVQQKVDGAKEADECWGKAARALRFGQPFKGGMHTIPEWDEVWREQDSVVVPRNLDSEAWIPIREALQENKQIVLHDKDKHRLLAFRLELNGQVDMDVRRPAQALRKRGFYEPADDLEGSAASHAISRPLDSEEKAILNFLSKRPEQDGYPVSSKAPRRVNHWSEVWLAAHPIDKPSTPVGSGKWLGIHSTLWQNGKVIVHQEGIKTLLGIKLDENGLLEWQARRYDGDLMQFLHDLRKQHGEDLKALTHGIRNRNTGLSEEHLAYAVALDRSLNPRPTIAFDKRLDAYIRTRPHFDGFPVLSKEREDPYTIQYAHDRFEGVWVTRLKARDGFRSLKVALFRPGQIPQVTDAEARLNQLLLDANWEGALNSDAARALKWGKPFKAPKQDPIDWRTVWQSPPSAVPKSNIEKWLDIRSALQHDRHVVLQDAEKGKAFAFRLDKAGKVEMQVRELLHGIHKRSDVPFHSGDSGAALDSKAIDGAIVKRAPTKPSRLDFYLNTMSTAEGERWSKGKEIYADLLHHAGIPVFEAVSEHEDLARQALRDYGSFWAYEIPEWEKHREPIPFWRRFQGSNYRVERTGNEGVFRRWREFVDFSKKHGDVAAKLAYGPPLSVPRRPLPSRGGWDQDVKVVSSTVNIHDARAELKQHGEIVVFNPSTDSRVGFRLDEDGNVVFEVISSAAHHLAKRMYGSSESHPYEWYGRYYRYSSPAAPSSLPGGEEEDLLSHTIYHKGVPVLLANNRLRKEKVDFALQQHGSAWITGEKDGGYLKPFRLREDGIQPDDNYNAVVEHLTGTKSFGERWDNELMYLKYGKPFAARQPAQASTSRNTKMFSWKGKAKPYEPKDWKEVAKHGTRVPLGDVSLSFFRRHLNERGFLVATRSNSAQEIGVRLLADGEVDIKDLAGHVRPLRKRSEVPSANDNSGAFVSPGSRRLAKRMDAGSSDNAEEEPHYPQEHFIDNRYVHRDFPQGLDSAAKEEMFANTLHSKGIPVLVGPQTKATVRHAVQSQQLKRSNFVNGYYPETGQQVGLRLDKTGAVEIEDLAKYMGRFRKRSDVASAPGSSSAFLSSASRHLAKRVDPSDSQKQRPEWYAAGYRFTAKEPLSRDARKRMFSDTIYHGGFPVLVAEGVSEDKVHHALTEYKGAWITSRDAEGNFLEPFYLSPDGAARQDSVRTDVWKYLQTAKEYERDHGGLLTVLRFGRRFPTQKRSYHPEKWETIFKSRTKAGWDLINSSPYSVRKQLEEAKHVVGHFDSRWFGVRLLQDGSIDIRDLTYLLPRHRKRNVEGDDSSFDPSPDSHHLVKRLGEENADSGQADGKRDYDYYRKTFRYQAPASRLTSEKEKSFDDTTFYKGRPVLLADRVPESKVQHALRQHRAVWITEESEPSRYYREPFLLKQKGRPTRWGWKGVLKHLLAVDQYLATSYRQAMVRVYGKQFRAQASSFKSAPLEEPASVETMTSSSEWLRLSTRLRGLGSLARTLHKRMDPPPGSSTSPTHPITDPKEDSSKIEFYTDRAIPLDPDVPKLGDEERRQFFAGDIHWNGAPVFHPETDQRVSEKAQYARRVYPGYWVVGHFANNPNVNAARFVKGLNSDWVSRRHEAEVLNALVKSAKDRSRWGRDTELFWNGPGFAARQRHWWLNYKTPDAEEVRQHAPKVPADTPMEHKWLLLNTHNMIVIGEGRDMVGFALDKAGKVVRQFGPKMAGSMLAKRAGIQPGPRVNYAGYESLK